MAALIADPPGGVHLCVHGVGGDHYPVEVEGLEKLPDGGDLWLDLSATRAWVSTAPVAWSRADRRCGAEACPRRAPRTVSPVHRDDCSSLDGTGTSAQPRPQTGVEIGGVQILQHPPDG